MGAPEAFAGEVHFVPLGPLAPGLAAEVAAGVSRRIAAPCRLCAASSVETARRIPARDQADADALLDRLDAAGNDDSVRVGLTSLDVAIPIFTFVFGRARQGGRACLVSLARLDPALYGLPADPRRATERAVVEVLHELGHVAGLVHCRDFACLMHFAASVEAIDVRGSTFCGACAPQLPAWLRPPP
ncbi:MAG: hypothetical protein HY317_01430 [Acidobacteria bacterium]|nr:hypothetical protein [Acidobacteriota bacterium]